MIHLLYFQACSGQVVLHDVSFFKHKTSKDIFGSVLKQLHTIINRVAVMESKKIIVGQHVDNCEATRMAASIPGINWVVRLLLEHQLATSILTPQ